MALGSLQFHALFRPTPSHASPHLRHPNLTLPRPLPSLTSPNLRSRTLRLTITATTNSDQLPTEDPNPIPQHWPRRISTFISTNFLPLSLVTGVVLGLADPTYGCLAHQHSLSKFSTFGIFIISGLTLRSDEIGAAAQAWPAGLFGLASIMLFSPLLSKFILELRLTPQEFVNGLAIFFCMPTTLSTGVALTNLMKGNSALALAMTVISNLSGILLVPFWLSKFIGHGVGVSIPVTPLLKSLVVTLLIPLIIGKLVRDSSPIVAAFVDRNRRYFSYANSVILSLVPWMQVSQSRSLLLTVNPVTFLASIVIGLVLHMILLVFNSVAVRCLAALSNDGSSVFAKKENARAVIVVASQKTLPVMVAVVEQLRGAFGESALLVLPCVAIHINQIIMDSFLVNFWVRKDQPSAKLVAS